MLRYGTGSAYLTRLALIGLLVCSPWASFGHCQEEETPTSEEIPNPKHSELEIMPMPQAETLCPDAPPEEPGSPVPQTEPFKDPPIKPTFKDWLTGQPAAQEDAVNRTDPLLRPPFAGQPTENIKGLAAGIRAIELDARNRMLAVQYLGTVDCVTYPQAKEMLIQVMTEDPQEEVRYEAVMALRLMLTHGYDQDQDVCECHGCCDRREIVQATQRHAGQAKRKAPKKKVPLVAKLTKVLKAPSVHLQKKREERKYGPLECRRYDWCRGCCGARVLQALTKVAYDTDAQGCPVEPSVRIRQAAVDALCLCPCQPVTAPYVSPIPIDTNGHKGGEEVPGNGYEPTLPPAVPPSEASREVTPLHLIKARSSQYPDLPALKGYCIVSLQSKQFVASNPDFSSIYDGHTYFFASADAKAEFDRFPEGYAPAYRGNDPVEWIDSQRQVAGQYLRLHQGRFFLFSSKDNWTTFLKQPGRYIPTDVARASGQE